MNKNALAGQFRQYAVVFWAYNLLHQPHYLSTVFNRFMTFFYIVLKKPSMVDLGLQFDSESDLDSKVGDH
jgi:hypothetical protein